MYKTATLIALWFLMTLNKYIKKKKFNFSKDFFLNLCFFPKNRTLRTCPLRDANGQLTAVLPDVLGMFIGQALPGRGMISVFWYSGSIFNEDKPKTKQK